MLHLRCGKVNKLQSELCEKGDSMKSCGKGQLTIDSVFSNKRFFTLRIIKVIKVCKV